MKRAMIKMIMMVVELVREKTMMMTVIAESTEKWMGGGMIKGKFASL